MKRRVIAMLLWSAASLFCLSSEAERQETLGPEMIESLNINMSPERGNFMVVDSRMTETGTAAVIGGIIGAGINSAVNADEDKRKAQPYESAASEIEIASLVETALRETLTGKAFPVSENDLASHVLSVEIKDWGLSRVSFQNPEVSVFLKVAVVMKSGKTVVWDTYLKESGRSARFLADTTPEQFSEDMRALAAKTGKRIAYEIIYR